MLPKIKLCTMAVIFAFRKCFVGDTCSCNFDDHSTMYFVQMLLPFTENTWDSITFVVEVSIPNYALGMSLGCLIAGTTLQHAQNQVEFSAKGKLLQVCSNYPARACAKRG